MFEVDSQLMVSAHCSNNFSVDPKFALGLRALLLRNAAKPHSTA